MKHQTPSKAATFTGRRAHFTHIQNYTATIDELFPLLCPVRESDYLTRWACDIIYLKSGLIEIGGVFTTSFPHDGPDKDVWIVSRYEPDQFIQFVRVNGWRSIIYNIEVQAAGEGKITLFWEQIITGLNDKGNVVIKTLREEDFKSMLDDMEQRLQYYLDAGEIMVD